MSIHDFVTTYANPTTYGLDAPTMAIIMMVFGGCGYYFKNFFLKIFNFLRRYPFISFSIVNTQTNYRKYDEWVNEILKYSILPIKTYTNTESNRNGINELLNLDYGTYYIKIPGYPLLILDKITPSDSEMFENADDLPFWVNGKKVKLVFKFLTLNKGVINRLSRDAFDSFNRRHQEDPKISLKTWDGSYWQCEYPKMRSISTIVQKEDQVQRIIDNCKSFFDEETKNNYDRKGLIHKRTILFEGPPGTGKSSLIRAIASELMLDIFYLNLEDFNSNEGFIKSIRSIVNCSQNSQNNSLLLIEDIDRSNVVIKDEYKQKEEKITTGRGLTLNTIMNFLDGPLSIDGILTIITTNHIEKLNEAVIRDGRIDLIERIDYLDLDLQLKLFCKLYEISLTDLKELVIIPRSANSIPACVIQGEYLRTFYSDSSKTEKIKIGFNKIFNSNNTVRLVK